MERLINVSIFSGFFFGLFGRGSLFFFCGALLLVIGDIPARAFEMEGAQGNDFLGFSPAVDAFFEGFG